MNIGLYKTTGIQIFALASVVCGAIIHTFPGILWRLFGCDIVMFNFSDHGTIYYFPLLSKIARLAHKKSYYVNSEVHLSST